MNGVKQIIIKEFNRVFTDRKLIFSLFILPALLMVGMYYLIAQMQTAAMDDIEKHKSTVYIQNAPEGFQDIIKASDYSADIEYIKQDKSVKAIKDDILNGNTDLLVVFEDDFLNKVADYESSGVIPDVKTFFNPSEDYSSTARNEFVGQVLSTYQQQLLAERVGDLSKLTVFTIDVNPKASEIMDDEKAAGKYLSNILPYLITFMLFAGVMALVVDAITGEKERGTMASMLLTPLHRKEIVLGKLVSLTLLSCLSAAVYAIAMIVSMPKIFEKMADSMDGLQLKLSVTQMVELFIIMITLVFFYVTIVSLAAVLAKTAKEANTFVTPIYFMVIICSMITMFTGNGEQELFKYAIPVYGSAISMQDIFIGELTVAKFGITIGGILLISALFTGLIVKAFNSEKIMFNA